MSAAFPFIDRTKSAVDTANSDVDAETSVVAIGVSVVDRSATVTRRATGIHTKDGSVIENVVDVDDTGLSAVEIEVFTAERRLSAAETARSGDANAAPTAPMSFSAASMAGSVVDKSDSVVPAVNSVDAGGGPPDDGGGPHDHNGGALAPNPATAANASRSRSKPAAPILLARAMKHR